MLLGQTAINFAANVLSAAFGLVNVMLFTRLFTPAEFGVYVLGLGIATVAATLTSTWLRLPIIREQARGDGTDIRGILVPGLALSCLLTPLIYLGLLLTGIGTGPALAAAVLALAISLYETGQDLLRARLQFFTAMKATILRAVMVSLLGAAVTLLSRSGGLLLVSTAGAYFLVALAFTYETWGGTKPHFDRIRLLGMARAGLPLTVSVTLSTLSTVIDRFMIAHFIGNGAAGQFTAGADLVRQALIIPAISAAAAFFPVAVQIHANQGHDAVRCHLDECFEFLIAIVLPSCVGFAIVSPYLANVILGGDFKDVAAMVMPIVAMAIIFQVVSSQYLHLSFLLSGRNTFFLLSAAPALAVNAVVSVFLIQRIGVVGAAWGRLAAEIAGFLIALLLTRWAFPMPLPYLRLTRVLIATMVMAVAVRSIELVLPAADKDSLAILLLAGMVSYLAMCWWLDIAKTRGRLSRGMGMVRNAIAR